MVSVEELAKEFEISKVAARDILNTEFHRVFKSKWQTWALILVLFALLAWQLVTRSFGVPVTLVMFVPIFMWAMHCKKLSEPAVRKAAQEKSIRIRGSYL